MPRHTRTARAEKDLVEIWLYIAKDNPQAADGLLDAIERASVRLARNPRMGAARPDLALNLRYFTVGNYRIL